MFKLDRSTFEYLEDLSNPEIRSSSDVESIQLKREILKLSFITLVVTTFVVGTIIILFIFFLPGLFNVFIQVFWYYISNLLNYWKILIIAFILLSVIIYLSYRNS